MNYMIDPVLDNLLECCTHTFREGVLYLELDDYNYLVDVNVSSNDDFTCFIWGYDRLFTFTDAQKDTIYLKVINLLEEEEESLKENGNNILY